MSRILYLSFTFAPAADGVSEAGSSLVFGLVRAGHDVTVATGRSSLRDCSDKSINPKVVEFAFCGSAMPAESSAAEMSRYGIFLLDGDFDLVIAACVDTWPVRLALPYFSQIKGKKILISHGFSAHKWYPHGHFPWGLGAWARSLKLAISMPWIFRRFDHVVFLSDRRDFDRFFDHTLAHLFGYRRHSIIPNGVDIEVPGESCVCFRETFGIESRLFFLCVANYSERKNQILAARAFQRAAVSDATLVFVGSEFNEFSNAAQAAIIPDFLQSKSRVIFLENVSRELVRAAFREADLFLLPAKEETQPIVLLEAMAQGVPFVSTDTGCVTDFHGGIIANNEVDFASAITLLASNERKRIDLGKAGCEQAQTRYARETVLAEYISLVEKTLSTTYR